MSYKDKDKQRKYQREWRRNYYLARKIEIINLLGSKCIKCEISDIRVLEIDHIEPILRSANGIKSGSNLYDLIHTNKLNIEEIQLLCANCHRIKTYEDRTKFKNYTDR